MNGGFSGFAAMPDGTPVRLWECRATGKRIVYLGPSGRSKRRNWRTFKADNPEVASALFESLNADKAKKVCRRRL